MHAVFLLAQSSIRMPSFKHVLHCSSSILSLDISILRDFTAKAIAISHFNIRNAHAILDTDPSNEMALWRPNNKVRDEARDRGMLLFY